MFTLRTRSAGLFLLLALAACSSPDDATTPVEEVATPVVVATPEDSPAGTADPIDTEPTDAVLEEDPAAAEDQAVEEPRFEFLAPDPGGESIIVDGAIVRGTQDTFIIEVPTCCTGEELYASITSPEGNAVFAVLDPSGEEFVTEQTNASLVLDQEGEWQIIVGATRGNAPYEMQVGISVNAG